ncbi:trypsin-like serine protease [Bradyrhizobium sp.]|uniref:S1 family peptidase n=1 Tax=Bradyrhizobium sp. TaxID=376 RepID=UPI001D1CA5D7|nr:trypsin-like serine protease [Bradyrhizobium sp.]MBI5320333.1 trypsin-like serine protease [Bradyrhizobium sp.]
MHRTILAATAVLLTASVLCADRAAALVGADLADRTIQRYTVAIGNPKGRCTGVVLAQNIVLTAAHCIVPGEKVWVGDHAGSGSQTIPSRLSAVDEIVPHPLYSRRDTGSPDLAMLRLATPLPDRFLPATLSSRHLAEGDNLIAAGYGKASAEETRSPLVLRMVLLRVTNAFRGWAILTSVSEDRAGGAPGDSGGPLFSYRGMHSLVGLIVSISDKRTRAVALAAHYSWIKETQAKLSGR